MSKLTAEQALFNAAWRGLKSQGFERSVGPFGGCRYRGEGGKCCAIGWAIPDEAYVPDMEGQTASGLGVQEAVRHSLDRLGLSLPDSGFLSLLQLCHDVAWTPEEMESRLRLFASEAGLVVPDA